MSAQIILQGQLVGIEEFLTAASTDEGFLGRAHWVTLLSEMLPRVLLAELGLPKILLGSAGGGLFLLVLPGDARGQAHEFLSAARTRVDETTGGRLRLLWAMTENLGDWSVVRKRINDVLQRQREAPAAGAAPPLFEPQSETQGTVDDGYFAALARQVREAECVGWSPEEPALIRAGPGRHTWSLTSAVDGIVLARHSAPSDDSVTFAPAAALAARAQGRAVWGVLRGDVDNFGIRIRRAQLIEEHVQLSVLFKQFFAGELEVISSLPEFWRKVSVIYTGGDEFAVYGAWDALILLAREVHRVFRRFTEENLKDFPGPEGKTLSMALALAPQADVPLVQVYGEAGRRLDLAKTVDKDCFHLLGGTLEWKQLSDAAELKDMMARMLTDYGCSTQLLRELGALYRETPLVGEQDTPPQKPWRVHRRLGRATGPTRDRELQRLRSNLLSELIGKSASHWKLRPAGRVAVEWAKLETEV